MEIIFRYSATTAGGVQSLFLRTAAALNKSNLKVTISGKEVSGYVKAGKKIIQDESIVLNKASSLQWIKKIVKSDEDTVFIGVASSWLHLWFLIVLLFRKNYYLWCVHPNNLVRFSNYDKLRSLFIRLMKPYLQFLLTRGRIKFMDQSCVRNVEKLYHINITPDYWPICKKISDPKVKYQEDEIERPKVMWVGRLDSKWKTDTLVPLFKAVKEENFIFTVVGAGPIPEWVERNMELNPSIKFKHNLSLADLDKLYGKQDLIVGMGTTLIEGASHGIPVFSLDLDDSSGRGVWFYKRKGYSLGGIDELKSNSATIHLKQAIQEVKTNKKWIGLKCHAHVYKNHNIENLNKEIIHTLLHDN